MLKTILIVGLGGFAGSTTRFLVSKLINEGYTGAFPWGTFTVNIVGCFLLGFIYALSGKHNFIAPEWRFFLATGFCGSFTTFSTFSYQKFVLYQSGHHGILFLYLAASIIIGLSATFLGVASARAFWG